MARKDKQKNHFSSSSHVPPKTGPGGSSRSVSGSHPPPQTPNVCRPVPYTPGNQSLPSAHPPPPAPAPVLAHPCRLNRQADVHKASLESPEPTNQYANDPTAKEVEPGIIEHHALIRISSVNL